MINTKDYNPLVSIALTTYNGGQLIREQIDSILVQTYQNFEIVISDDGSDTETIDILESYADQNSRVSWSRSTLSRGYVPNTQNAISLCQGEIIFLCDQDDVWFPNKIEEHVKAYEDSSVGWVCNRFVITDAVNNPIGDIEDRLPGYFREKTMLDNAWGSCVGAAQTSYRADLLHSVMPIPPYALAHDSWIQLAIYPAKRVFIDQPLNTYRQHNNQQVGMETNFTNQEIMEKEAAAIANNLCFISKLPFNSNLAWWKRLYFAVVYVTKRLRSIFRRTIGKTDSRLVADETGTLVMK